MTEIKTTSPRETELLGEELGRLAGPGDIFCLYGNLGAGKTCLARGIARGAGTEDRVTSPTFTIIKEYTGRIPVYHIDVYRLESAEEVEDLGFEEYLYGVGLTLLEWPERVEEVLPGERLDVYISGDGEGENARKIVLAGKGGRYRHLLEELSKNVRAGN